MRLSAKGVEALFVFVLLMSALGAFLSGVKDRLMTILVGVATATPPCPAVRAQPLNAAIPNSQPPEPARQLTTAASLTPASGALAHRARQPLPTRPVLPSQSTSRPPTQCSRQDALKVAQRQGPTCAKEPDPFRIRGQCASVVHAVPGA